MNSELLTRKLFLQHSAAFGTAAFATLFGNEHLARELFAAEFAQSKKKFQPLNRFPRMVHEFFVEKVRLAEQQSQAVKNSLRTKEDAESYVKSVQ